MIRVGLSKPTGQLGLSEDAGGECIIKLSGGILKLRQDGTKQAFWLIFLLPGFKRKLLMEPEEFKAKVEIAVGSCLGSYPSAVGCDFFISDMEELFEEWESESQHLERS